MLALPLVPPKQVISTTESMVISNVFGSLTVCTFCMVQFVTMFRAVIRYSPTVKPGKIPVGLEEKGIPTKLPETGINEYSIFDGVPPIPETETRISSLNDEQLISFVAVTLIVSKTYNGSIIAVVVPLQPLSSNTFIV